MRLPQIAALSLAISALSSLTTFGATWKLVNGTWYADTCGWVECSDGWYYTDATGKMLTDTVVDGYYISITGRMINPENESERAANRMLTNSSQKYCVADSEELLKQLAGKGYRGSVCHWDYEDGTRETGFTEEQQAHLAKQMAVITNWLRATDGMFNNLPIEERVRAIHDLVINTLQYGDSGGLYQSLHTGYGVCQEYASLFQLLCERNGIDCEYVAGAAFNSVITGPHAWNRVYINGEAFLVDCCWDDTAKTDKYFMQKTFECHYEE